MANLKSVFYASVRLALMGKEKVEQVAKKFVKENKLKAIDGKKFIDEAVKHAEATKNELFKKINEMVKATVDKIELITHIRNNQSKKMQKSVQR
ncbi:MAG: hypothetical protein LE178_02590 [Endomicrobium sp.]|nr:hypothetical protein [Endomicrobium sp.]